MGQSALRDRETPFGIRGTVYHITRYDVSSAYRKGIGLIFPNPDVEIGPSGVQRGDANEPGDAGGSPGKSSLFFVRVGPPGIGLAGDRGAVPVKHRASRGVRCALVGP